MYNCFALNPGTSSLSSANEFDCQIRRSSMDSSLLELLQPLQTQLQLGAITAIQYAELPRDVMAALSTCSTATSSYRQVGAPISALILDRPDR